MTITVACMVLMLEQHGSATSVLTETNVIQFLRLFCSRAMHSIGEKVNAFHYRGFNVVS